TEIYEKLKKAAAKYTATDQDEAGKHKGTDTGTGTDTTGKGADTGTSTTDPSSKIDTSKVTYDKVNGSGSVDSYISQALDKNGITDPTARKNWTEGYKTLISRESSGNVMAVNTTDSNATSSSVIVGDGNTANCSRGLAQCIPSTFAAYHVAGTSSNIYDPVANIAASMNYSMGHYGVSKDGSDLTSKVQQADSGRGAKGY
ncbi:MAG: transglycosylase SLT domain-containing protein, partial [Segniliparus sp.]|uniref:transglycosylase SLT domain-containing protein n=1 Tax=Segniliparus sp. TaxID=2804064 RepID=UPI003F3BBF28